MVVFVYKCCVGFMEICIKPAFSDIFWILKGKYIKLSYFLLGMDRAVEDKTILDVFVEDFVRVIEEYAKYAVVSGFVAIAHGRTRGTEDVDVIISRVSKDVFKTIHAALDAEGFECIQSSNPETIYDSYLKTGDSVRYVRKGVLVPEMELKLAKDELDDYQLLTRKQFALTGLDIYFSSIEMNIAFKEELLKSDKDLEDAAHLRKVYEGKISEAEIKKIKGMIRRVRL